MKRTYEFTPETFLALGPKASQAKLRAAQEWVDKQYHRTGIIVDSFYRGRPLIRLSPLAYDAKLLAVTGALLLMVPPTEFMLGYDGIYVDVNDTLVPFVSSADGYDWCVWMPTERYTQAFFGPAVLVYRTPTGANGKPRYQVNHKFSGSTIVNALNSIFLVMVKRYPALYDVKQAG